jgi:hypothetical protein
VFCNTCGKKIEHQPANSNKNPTQSDAERNNKKSGYDARDIICSVIGTVGSLFFMLTLSNKDHRCDGVGSCDECNVLAGLLVASIVVLCIGVTRLLGTGWKDTKRCRQCKKMYDGDSCPDCGYEE